MKKYIKLILFLLLCKFDVLYCQTVNWAKPDSLIVGSINAIYHDTSDNSTYVGGFYYRVDGVDTIVGIGKYKNGQWYRMGDGVDWWRNQPLCSGCMPNPVKSIIKYNDTIYITGEFSHTNGKKLNGLAKWDGVAWQPVGNSCRSGNSYGGGNKFKIYNNELYIVGAFDSIAGIAANSLAKYDGLIWQSVHNLPIISGQSGDLNLIKDLEFYNNELYLTGVMYNNSTIFGVVKWDGTNWVNPGFGVYGLATSLGMVKFKNELYVIGTWSHANNPNNISNCIAKFNGSIWQDVGGGMLVYPNYIAGVRTYEINSNYLFVGGNFNYCNNTKGINSIARYDGTNWCSLDTTYHPTSDILAMEFVNDTLYIGGYLGAQLSNSGFAYCKNINYTDTCSKIIDVSLNELQSSKNNFLISPNPTNSIINIIDEQNELQNSMIEIKNSLGQVIFSSTFSTQIDISHFSSGMYFLTVQNNSKKKTVKIVKQ